MRNKERAEAARETARELGEMLYEKQMAYGDSGSIALGVWEARLAQYRVTAHAGAMHSYQDVGAITTQHRDEEAFYVLPASLIAHIPRLTRVDDRINRIVSNPGGDRTGEDPWRDMAGDAVIGCIMPRRSGCPESGCELEQGHGGPHAKVDASGVRKWNRIKGVEWDPATPAPLGSANRDKLARDVQRLVLDEEDARTDRQGHDTYTHGYDGSE